MKSQPVANTPSHPTECGSWVSFYVAVDSVDANRLFFANATVQLLASSGTVDGNVVPLLSPGEPLPPPVHDLVNGALLNVAVTDLRPEDAKFATIRALTSQAGARIPRTRFTSLG